MEIRDLQINTSAKKWHHICTFLKLHINYVAKRKKRGEMCFYGYRKKFMEDNHFLLWPWT